MILAPSPTSVRPVSRASTTAQAASKRVFSVTPSRRAVVPSAAVSAEWIPPEIPRTPARKPFFSR